MKYSRHNVGDRVELISMDFLQVEEGKVVSGISGGLHNKHLPNILRQPDAYTWNTIEIDYVLLEVTKVKSTTSAVPMVVGKVLYSSGRVSEELGPGDSMYIHEDIREFVFDAVVSRYVWSNYIINPSKPDIDYGVFCLCEYGYIDNVFRNRSLLTIEKARTAKKLIAEQVNLKRDDYALYQKYRKEAHTYQRILVKQISRTLSPMRAIRFTFSHEEYSDFFDTLFNEISKELNVTITSVCRVSITEIPAGKDSVSMVDYRVIAFLPDSDYMLLSHDNSPSRNAVLKLINAKIRDMISWPSGRSKTAVIRNPVISLTSSETATNDIAAFMRFLFE